MQDISELLSLTQRNNASDLHLSSKKPPLMRIHGEMIRLDGSPDLPPETVKSMLYSIMTEQQRAVYEADLELDFAVSFSDEMRFRVNAFNTIDGPAAVFRVVPTKVLTLEQIKAPEILTDLCKKEKGIILVTGPTGSGKSTTLAAMINHINETTKKHIITVEDPIEFVHESKMSLINQREVGVHTKSFAKALKASLREDPDVILVGELRDLETVALALTAAETGHIVMGTLHTSSAAKTIDRIIDVFPANEKDMIRSMLAGSLEAVISQKLLRKKDGSGRVAAHEIMLGTNPVRNLIRENQIPQINSMIQIGSRYGMQLMKDTVGKLLDEGIITKDAAREALYERPEEAEENGNQGSAATGTGGGF